MLGRALHVIVTCSLISFAGCASSSLLLPEEQETGAAEQETSRRHEWFLVHFQGQLAGYSFLREIDIEDGGVETFHRTRLRVRRAGEVSEMEISLTVRENGDGKIRDFVAVQKTGPAALTTRGKIVDETSLELEILQEGAAPRRLVQEFDPAARGPSHTEATLRERLTKEGDRVEQLVFSPDVLQCVKQTSVAGPLENVTLVDGSTAKLRRVDNELAIPPGIRMTTWLDKDGRLTKSMMPAMGITMVRTSREKVLAEKFTSPPEIFITSSVKISRQLPEKRDKIVYRIRPKRRGVENVKSLTITPCDAAGHVFEPADEDGAWNVRVRTVTPRQAMRRPIVATRELAKYLAPSAYIESDDPKIQELARTAIGDETDGWTAARKLEKLVHAYIHKKNLGTAFATARDVAISREGDCTEHSVLLAALARASGIPARVVAGLTYYRRSFVGHMWTEVWIGEWVPLDATLGKGVVVADHIGFATSALDSSSISSLFLGLIPILSGVEIDVLSER